MTLVVLVFLLFFMTFVGEYVKKENNKILVAIAICIIYSAFWSFQPIGNGHDIDRYYFAYIRLPFLTEFENTTNFGLFYSLLGSFLKTIGFTFTGFLFFIFLLGSLLYLFALRVFTQNYIFALSLVLLSPEIFITMMRLHRQGLAVAFMFFAIALLYSNRKYLSAMILIFPISLHITFLPLYALVVTTMNVIKKSFIYKILFFILVALILYFFSKNLDIINIIMNFVEYDGKYTNRAKTYIEDTETRGGELGAGFMLNIVIASFMSIYTYFLYKKNTINIELHLLVSFMLWFSVLIMYFLIELDVFSRLGLYLSPFYGLALALALNSFKGNNRLLYIFFTLSIFAFFYQARIFLRDENRIPFGI